MTEQLKITCAKMKQALKKGAEIWQDKNGNCYIMPNKIFDLAQCENLLALVENTAEKYGYETNLKLVK